MAFLLLKRCKSSLLLSLRSGLEGRVEAEGHHLEALGLLGGVGRRGGAGRVEYLGEAEMRPAQTQPSGILIKMGSRLDRGLRGGGTEARKRYLLSPIWGQIVKRREARSHPLLATG